MKRQLIAAACVLALLLGMQQRSATAAGRPGGVQGAAAQALIVPASADGRTVVVSAAGFAPLETVTFRFGLIDPFTGVITNPLFIASGMADAGGRLGPRWGYTPVPPQTLPASLPGGLYALQAGGGRSGRSAMTAVSLPFVVTTTGLYCSGRPIPPGRYGFVFGSPAASFAPGTEVLGAADFPVPAEFATRTNQGGSFYATFQVPVGTPAGGYALVVAGLGAGSRHGEQLRTCALTVGA